MSGSLDSAGLVGIDMGGMGGDDRLVRLQQGFHNDEIGLGTAYQEVNIGVRSTADAADSFPGGCTAGIQTVAHSLFQVGVHQGLENFWVGALAVIIAEAVHNFACFLKSNKLMLKSYRDSCINAR